MPKADPGVARMPVDLYRVVVTERVLGESMVFSVRVFVWLEAPLFAPPLTG